MMPGPWTETSAVEGGMGVLRPLFAMQESVYVVFVLGLTSAELDAGRFDPTDGETAQEFATAVPGTQFQTSVDFAGITTTEGMATIAQSGVIVTSVLSFAPFVSVHVTV